MQKWLLIALLSSCNIGLLFAQDVPKVVSTAAFLTGFKLREINAEKIVTPSFNFGIKQIEVIDNRYDTLHVGSINQDKKRDLWLCFADKQPLSQVISNSLMQPHLQNPLSLLVVIKDFWFTESKDAVEFGERKPKYGIKNNLVCKLEFYQKFDNNTVVAITRLDTILTALNENATYKAMNIDLIGNLLRVAVDKIEKAIHSTNYTKRNSIPLPEIYRTINERFEKPILQDTVLRKGVYKTKEEFLNNVPSDTNFTVKQDTRRFIALYLKDENGNDYLSRDSWGYCDGTTIFINNKGMFDPLYRIEHAFYWRAFNMVKYESVPAGFGNIPLGNGQSIFVNVDAKVDYDSHILYLLNLDKGTHY